MRRNTKQISIFSFDNFIRLTAIGLLTWFCVLTYQKEPKIVEVTHTQEKTIQEPVPYPVNYCYISADTEWLICRVNK